MISNSSNFYSYINNVSAAAVWGAAVLSDQKVKQFHWQMGCFVGICQGKSVATILSRNVNELKMWITEAMGDIMHNTDEYDVSPCA